MRLSPLTKAGLLLGIGVGGLIDGIVLHQILQWHHLVCTTHTCEPRGVDDLKRQTFYDGLFHAAVLAVTLVGVLQLWRAGRSPVAAGSTSSWSGRALLGGMLAGWGLFNFVEGLIDHQILGIHHVRPGSPNQLAWDLGFLAFGLALVLVGWLLVRDPARRGPRDADPIARPDVRTA